MKPDKAQLEKLGTVTQAADRLGVDSATVWEMVASGRLEATRESDDQPWTILAEELDDVS